MSERFRARTSFYRPQGREELFRAARAESGEHEKPGEKTHRARKRQEPQERRIERPGGNGEDHPGGHDEQRHRGPVQTQVGSLELPAEAAPTAHRRKVHAPHQHPAAQSGHGRQMERPARGTFRLPIRAPSRRGLGERPPRLFERCGEVVFVRVQGVPSGGEWQAVEELLDRLQETGNVRKGLDPLAELAAVGDAVGVPAAEFPQFVQGVRGALPFRHLAKVLEDQGPALGQGGHPRRPACQKVRGLVEDPGVLGRCPADQDAVATGLPQHLESVFGFLDVAVAEDGDRNGLLEAGNRVPTGPGRASKHLPRGPGVQGHGVESFPFSDSSQLEVVLPGLVEPQAELDGQGDGHRPAAGRQDRAGELEISHQGAARAAFQDLVGRTAHVDVAGVGAQSLDLPGGLGHRRGVRAVDLDRNRPLLFGEVHQLERPAHSSYQSFRGNELHRHQAHAADAADNQAEIPIRHPRHRGEDEGSFEPDASDGHLHGRDSSGRIPLPQAIPRLPRYDPAGRRTDLLIAESTFEKVPRRARVALPRRLPGPAARWLEGRDLDLLEPLRWVAPGTLPNLPASPVARRGELAPWLERWNRAWGHPRAGELAECFARPDTRVVLAGQQTGLFGGPLLVLTKMAAAVRWAEELTRAGQPAVALFWMASEDHDFAEVSSARFLVEGRIETVSLGEDEAELVPVGRRVLDEAVEEPLARLRALYPSPRFRDWTGELARWWASGCRFPAAFARQWIELLGARAPLFVDPLEQEFQLHTAPVKARLVAGADAVEAQLVARGQAIRSRGLELQVPQPPGTFPLFWHDEEGRRRRVLRLAGDRWAVRGRSGALGSWADLEESVRSEPDRFSPSALSRPAVGDSVLGTALHVLGPGELAYFAQAAPLYFALGLEAPAVVLRPGLLLLDRKSQEWLRELGGSLEDLLRGPEAFRHRIRGDGFDSFVDAGRERILEILTDWSGPTAALDPDLLKPLERTRETVARALEQFASRIDAARLRRDAVRQERLERLLALVWPEGEEQERTLAAALWIGRFGKGFLARLLDSLNLDARELELLDLSEESELASSANPTGESSDPSVESGRVGREPSEVGPSP